MMRNEPLILVFEKDMQAEGEAVASLIQAEDVAVFTLPQLQAERMRPGLPVSLFYTTLYDIADTFLIFPSTAILQNAHLSLFIHALLDGVVLGEKRVVPVFYPTAARFPLLADYVGFDMRKPSGEAQLRKFLQQIQQER